MRSILSVVRARSVGSGIVQAARDRGVEMIVMGAEPPSRIRGGAVLGGIGGSRPAEIGPVTEYVLRRAPVPGAGDGAAERRLAARTRGFSGGLRRRGDRARGLASDARVAAAPGA